MKYYVIVEFKKNGEIWSTLISGSVAEALNYIPEWAEAGEPHILQTSEFDTEAEARAFERGIHLGLRRI